MEAAPANAEMDGGEQGEGVPEPRGANGPLRTLIATLTMALAFCAVGAQLVRLALQSQGEMSASLNEAVAQSFARPDIVDRNGRLLATDVEAYSLFADPARVIDRDEAVEKLAVVFPDMDTNALRNDLSDRSRRFVWVRRGLPPRTAQAVHNLGLPREFLPHGSRGDLLATHHLSAAGITDTVLAALAPGSVSSCAITQGSPQ